MTAEAKLKKRGFVMTGGGAKGLYEAGVIHAFHITGMEFDIITGSSIGAMNSVFFGEYLFQKNQLPDTVKLDPATVVEAMDPLVKAYQHAWLQMPDKKLIDDSAQGPLGRLKDDLQAFKISLPLVTRLGWWWTDPDKSAAPPAAAWPALLKLMQELIKRLGGAGTLLSIFRNNRSTLLSTVARTYLAKFGMDRSLVPAADDHKLKDVFTQPVSPLRPEHLSGDANIPDDPSVKRYILVDPARSLGDYNRQGIAVRVTRANYRTGRLEISAHVTLDGFVNFMEKQAWRLEAVGPDKLPLGSFRLQVPGNPNAVNAGLASGRFPGVFAPFPIEGLYPAGDPENDLLYKLLDKWLVDPEVAEKVKQIIQERPERKGKGEHYWEDLITGWQKSESMRDFFPRSGDVYVDGGSIDNTPSNSAVDYVREWADNTHHSRRGVSLELFVIFLETEPKVDQEKVQDPAMFQVVKRTLAIQGAATRASDTNTVSTINTFGQRGEDLANALATVLESYRGLVDGLDEVTRTQVEASLYEMAKELPLDSYLGESPAGILKRLSTWAEVKKATGLPVQVDAVKIYPEEMPMGTLQFTERLGYRKANAIKMLAAGCYDALWALRTHLEADKNPDARDKQVLGMARKWMGFESLPADKDALKKLREEWRCTRTACAFFEGYCGHGKA